MKHVKPDADAAAEVADFSVSRHSAVRLTHIL